jgi:hypothetical protein
VRSPKRVTLGVAAAIAGATAMVAFSAPALAYTPGGEAITSPVSFSTQVSPSAYSPPDNSLNNPDNTMITVNGANYNPGTTVTAVVCDGLPPSNPNWSFGTDCDPKTETSGVGVSTTGGFQMLPTSGNTIQHLFRGQGPNDGFNCLAPDDDPNGTVTSDGGHDAIDNTAPAWGSTQGGNAFGGGTAGCQLRIAYQLTNLQSTDRFIQLSILPTGQSGQIPQSPLVIFLPIGAALVLGAGGTVLYRRRRAARAAV